MKLKYLGVFSIFLFQSGLSEAKTSMRLLAKPLVFQNASASFASDEEAQFLILLNQFRVKLGLNTLSSNERLKIASAKHGQWMLRQDSITGSESLAHEGVGANFSYVDRIKAEGYLKFTGIAENLACGYGDAASTFRQLALSPGHLINMISPRYREVGISRQGNGSEACPYYWVNTFGSQVSAHSDLPTVRDPRRITAALDEVTRVRGAAATSTAFEVQCSVPASLGQGLLVSVPVETRLKVSGRESGYQLELSYLANGGPIRTSYSVQNIQVSRSAFYPLLSIVSIPTSKFGGFQIQIDLQSERANFIPYPGMGGNAGALECTLSNLESLN